MAETPASATPPILPGVSVPTAAFSDVGGSSTEDVAGSHPEVSAAPLPACAGRYRVLEVIGRGGMGAVWRAHDRDLNRPLAVKVLLADHRGRPDLERRFLEEAQITGQLQHPGIPPVHEIGRLDDGRPFLAMKLIE